MMKVGSIGKLRTLNKNVSFNHWSFLSNCSYKSFSTPSIFKVKHTNQTFNLISNNNYNVFLSNYKKQYISSTPPQNYSFFDYNKKGGLDSILKLDTIENETTKTISTLWLDYHRNLPCISAAVDPPIYSRLKKRIDRKYELIFSY